MNEGKNLLIEEIITLISCALNGVEPEEELIKELDLTKVFNMAKAHSLTAIVAMALESSHNFSFVEPEISKCWMDAKNKAIRKNMLLDAEREGILGEMEKAGIWYMPLKGAILKDLYPKYGMRQMADNDILYDDSRKEDLKDIFLKRGYLMEKEGGRVHDVYMKEPVYNFEMHRALFSKNFNEEWAAYYDDIKQRLCPDQGKRFGYHFTDEDFYIYITAHAYKHYSGGGTGLRTLVDTFVFHQKKQDLLDMGYISAELEKLGIGKFEKQIRLLADRLFGDTEGFSFQKLTQEQQKMLLYFCGAGTYGTIRNRVGNQLKSFQTDGKSITFMTKLRYCCSRLFPGRKWCKTTYPFFYTHPYLLPFLWIFRSVRVILFNRKAIGHEMKALIKVKTEE